jgi:hypothetical protein
MRAGPLLIASLSWLSGCATEQRSRTAVATMESRPDGSVAEAIASKDQVDSTKRIREEMMRIDQRFPPPEIPRVTPPLYRVLAVTDQGFFQLEGKIQIVLEGVECSTEGMADLSKLLLRENARVAFVTPPRSGGLQPMPADLWLVEALAIGQSKPAMSYTRVAEAALLSGWCVPDNKGASSAYQRFLAIAAIREKVPPRGE